MARQPVVPVFVEVEGVDDTQGAVGGSQLRNHTDIDGEETARFL